MCEAGEVEAGEVTAHYLQPSEAADTRRGEQRELSPLRPVEVETVEAAPSLPPPAVSLQSGGQRRGVRHRHRHQEHHRAGHRD